MTGLASSQTQNAAATAALGIIASLKASGGLSGSGNGLFESLLEETKGSLSQVKAADPAPSAAQTNALSAEADSSSGGKRANVQAQAADDKADPAPPREKRAGASKTDKEAEASDQTAQAKAAQEEKDAKEALAEDREEDATQTDGVDASSSDEAAAVAAEKKDEEEEPLDDEALLALVAAFNPLDGKAPVKSGKTEAAAAGGENAKEEKKADSQTEDQPLTMAMAGAALPVQTERKVKSAATKAASLTAGTDQETATPLLTDPQPEAVEGQGVELQARQSPKAGGDFSLDGLENNEKAKPTLTQTEEKAVKETAVSVASGAGEVSFKEAVQKEAAPAQTAAFASIVAPQQTAAGSGASGASAAASGAVSGVSASSGVAATAALAGAENVKPSSSYDFASQLSAARVTKGGSVGLPSAVEQVAVQLNKAAKEGQEEMTIQLRPADLGKIEVKLTFSADHKVEGTIIVDKQSTLDLMQKDQSSLQRALQEAGLQADSGSLQFSLRGDGQNGSFAQNQGNASFSSSNWAVRAGGESADDTGALADASESAILSPGRVNLRV